VDRGTLGVRVHLQRHTGRRSWGTGERRARQLHTVTEIGLGSDSPELYLGQIEQSVDEQPETPTGVLDATDAGELGVLQIPGIPLLQQIRVPHDRGKRGAQLVRHVGNQLVSRTFRLFGFAMPAFQFNVLLP
jgi:hypothetical protein